MYGLCAPPEIHTNSVVTTRSLACIARAIASGSLPPARRRRSITPNTIDDTYVAAISPQSSHSAPADGCSAIRISHVESLGGRS